MGRATRQGGTATAPAPAQLKPAEPAAPATDADESTPVYTTVLL